MMRALRVCSRIVRLEGARSPGKTAKLHAEWVTPDDKVSTEGWTPGWAGGRMGSLSVDSAGASVMTLGRGQSIEPMGKSSRGGIDKLKAQVRADEVGEVGPRAKVRCGLDTVNGTRFETQSHGCGTVRQQSGSTDSPLQHTCVVIRIVAEHRPGTCLRPSARALERI